MLEDVAAAHGIAVDGEEVLLVNARAMFLGQCLADVGLRQLPVDSALAQSIVEGPDGRHHGLDIRLDLDGQQVLVLGAGLKSGAGSVEAIGDVECAI